MDIATLMHIIVHQWAVLMTAPIPFIAAGTLGLLVGYGFAWIIPRANSRSMLFGLGLMVIGLVVAVIGGIVLFIERPSVAAVATNPSKDRTATRNQLQT